MARTRNPYSSTAIETNDDPHALQSLFFERGKLLAAIAGVAFAANLGARPSRALLRLSEIVDRGHRARRRRPVGDGARHPLVDFADPLSPGVGDIVRAEPCVAARPVIFSWASIRKPSGGIDNVQLIAAEPRAGQALPWSLADGLPSDLRAPMRIAVDAADLSRLELPAPAIGAAVELQDRTVYVGAVTRGIRSFTVVPYLFAEPHEARRILGLADGQATFGRSISHGPLRAHGACGISSATPISQCAIAVSSKR